ncbi:hypothetical protein DFH28DRAFT_971186 [Melampsora americana]|nr:hypothetical protein DFH28DRAFT_971186 [Melampsora americana]
MNTIILLGRWYFVVSCCLCTLAPSERLVDGVIEGDGLAERQLREEGQTSGLGSRRGRHIETDTRDGEIHSSIPIGQGRQTHRYNSLTGDRIESHNEHAAMNSFTRMLEAYETDLSTPSAWNSMERDMELDSARTRYRESKEGMQKRLESLETFVPLDKDFKYTKHMAHPMTGMSKFFHKVTGRFTACKRLKDIRKLHPSITGDYLSFSFKSLELWLMVGQVELRPWSRIFNDGLYLQKTIITALESLQDKNLEVGERLWTLSVLDILQSLLPKGKLDPIREDPNTGGICRGGLELYLLRGLDHRPYNGRIRLFTLNESVTEALKRVELIVHIEDYLRTAKTNFQTPTFISIHDLLLQNKSLAKSQMVESLVSQAMHLKIVEDTPDEEIRCLYRIMQHLELFYPVAKQFGITEALKRVKLLMKIRYYLQSSSRYLDIRPKLTKVYSELIRIKSLDDANIVKALTLQCLPYINLKGMSKADIECLYHILNYMETLYSNSQEFAITEALERVELIMKIKNYLVDYLGNHQSSQIMKICNGLLKISSSDDTKIVDSLTTDCMEDIVNDTVNEDVEHVLLILAYLEKFHKSARKLVESWSLPGKPFRKAQQGRECQAELQPYLQEYFKKEEKNLYIMRLLLPFEGPRLVDSAYVKDCLYRLNIQESALAAVKGDIYGVVTKEDKYCEDQDFFIQMMYKASPYIEGIKEYLERNVWKDEKSGHYKFLSPILLPDEDESVEATTVNDETHEGCAICLGGFLKGQAVAKLKCGNVPHKFHEHCLSNWIVSSGGKDFDCPTCRNPTRAPLTIDQYILWGSPQAHHSNL